MATKEDFTDEEWKAMQKGVTGAGFLVSAGDRDFTDSFGEAGALAKYLAGQRETSESEFVRELANVRRGGFGLTDSAQEVQAETLALGAGAGAGVEPDHRDAGQPVPGVLHQLDVLDAGVGNVALGLPEQTARDHDLVRIEAVAERGYCTSSNASSPATGTSSQPSKSSQPPDERWRDTNRASSAGSSRARRP